MQQRPMTYNDKEYQRLVRANRRQFRETEKRIKMIREAAAGLSKRRAVRVMSTPAE